VVIVCVLIALAAGAYLLVSRIQPILTGSGCQAGTGRAAVSLEPQQAAIAATIAGVAHQRAVPPRAVTVAYAAAMQESHMHNLGYGDRDSVGVFQQRPSEGWGPARKLRDPVYASTKFFEALAAVPGYQQMPVYRAAQSVQHSADGFAYIQYQRLAARLTAAFTGGHPHSVWCWSPEPSHGKANLAAARRQLGKTFGPLDVTTAASPRDAPALRVRASQPPTGWTVASWLVTHAASYRIREVHYAGFKWRASAGSAGWTSDKGANTRGEVEAS